MPPIALTDEQLGIIQQHAAPLHAADRGAYLEVVAQLLNGYEIGDRVIAPACREAQRRFMRAPELESRQSNWR